MITTNIQLYSALIGKIILSLENDRKSKIEPEKSALILSREAVTLIIIIVTIVPFYWILIQTLLLFFSTLSGAFVSIITTLLCTMMVIWPSIMSKRKREKSEKEYHNIIDKHYNLVASLEDINTIDDIIKFITATMSLLEEIKKGWASEDTIRKEKAFIYLIIQDTSRILDKEMSECIVQLNTWKNMLYSINWDTLPWIQLQKQRLDQQIEQFEELQRVLVKI